MTHDFAKMTNYPPSNKFLSVASGKQLPIESHGNLVVDFQSGQDFVRIELLNDAYVPSLGYHLLSIPSCIGDGHTFVFDTKGVTVHLKSGQELQFLQWGRCASGTVIDSLVRQNKPAP